MLPFVIWEIDCFTKGLFLKTHTVFALYFKIYQSQTESITDDYIINWQQKLGTGINGPVRPCTNRVTGGRYALKILPDKPMSRTEINLHRRCSNHPSIVKIYDVYANEVQFPGEPHPRGRLLMVMELMDGGELFDRISQQKGFTERKAMN